MNPKVIPIDKNDWRKSSKTKMLLLAILIPILFSFIGGPVEKSYKVELPLQKWEKYFQGMEATRQLLTNSDLPYKTVSYLTDSILTPLNNEIAIQIQAQLAKDTTKKK